MTYRPRQRVQLPSLESARSIEATGERVKALFQGRDKVGQFLRATLGRTLVYAARVTPDIAYSLDDVDRVMKWGFGWELGPFELSDAIGVRELLESCATTDGTECLTPPLVAEALSSGRNRFRSDGLPLAAAGLQILKAAKDRQGVVRRNSGASLIDLGDGVLALEFHSKMNAIGPDTLQMMRSAIKEATTNFAALVIGNDAPDFSAGANLMLLLLEAQEGNWDDIDVMIRAFQDSNQALRSADVPVVSAVAGRTLGGGCEITLHAHRVQAAAETYIGLVEVGVGLIPGGGGTKEMLARAVADLPSRDTDLLPYVQRVFETIGFAKVSTSAAEARQLHYLGEADRVTMNRERLMADAKAYALELASEGHQRLTPRSVTVGGESTLATLKLGVHLAWRAGRISEHDATVGRALATVLAGGSLPHRTRVSEQYLLDLEREAFLSLCGQPKTLERIQYTLKTGKTLRN
jgi:3-hydroxyacyl-CoA dehydrogenase